MKTWCMAAVIFLIANSTLPAQSRHETLKLVSDTLARANEIGPDQQMSASAASDRINDALKLVVDLKDQLVDNPYIRITSISVGIPWGISVELEVLP